jgi:hypothetical protein
VKQVSKPVCCCMSYQCVAAAQLSGLVHAACHQPFELPGCLLGSLMAFTPIWRAMSEAGEQASAF